MHKTDSEYLKIYKEKSNALNKRRKDASWDPSKPTNCKFNPRQTRNYSHKKI